MFSKAVVSAAVLCSLLSSTSAFSNAIAGRSPSSNLLIHSPQARSIDGLLGGIGRRQGRECLNPSDTLCPVEGCCPEGTYCLGDGCCPDGRICTGEPTGCANPQSLPCPAGDFCCPRGTTCGADSCLTGGDDDLPTTASPTFDDEPTTSSSRSTSRALPTDTEDDIPTTRSTRATVDQTTIRTRTSPTSTDDETASSETGLTNPGLGGGAERIGQQGVAYLALAPILYLLL